MVIIINHTSCDGGEKMKIKELRKKAGISQRQLATSIGYKHQSTVAMIESGQRKIPADKIPILAKALHCEISDLFEKG